MTTVPKVSAIIVAAGSGSRLGGAVPKAYTPLLGVSMLRFSAQALSNHPAISGVIVAVAPEHESMAEHALQGLKHCRIVYGGATRSDSVRSSLAALKDEMPDVVLIHDAARPFLSAGMINNLLDACTDNSAAMPVLSVPDTLRIFKDGTWMDVPREGVMRVQTPQIFPYQKLVDAYANTDEVATDDIAIWQAFGGEVVAVEGDGALKKITYPEDLRWAEQQLTCRRVTRVGSGYDVHRLIPSKRGVICLGGIDIAHEYCLDGHSDADVVLHALTDALYGTLASGDIGSHFPPSDAAHRGRDSADFLHAALGDVTAANGIIQHVDITIICEAPKINPHRDAMRACIAALLGMDVRGVSVKATTTEGLGFTGRREGIAAQAVVTTSYLELPR